MKYDITCKLLKYLSDWEIATNLELASQFGHRFGGRIHTLRKMGVDIKTIRDVQNYSYELISIPKGLDYKNRRTIKDNRPKTLMARILKYLK